MARIASVSIYEFYGHEWADVLYESGRLNSHPVVELPKTVSKWLKGKDGIKWYDRTLDREITVYKEV